MRNMMDKLGAYARSHLPLEKFNSGPSEILFYIQLIGSNFKVCR